MHKSRKINKSITLIPELSLHHCPPVLTRVHPSAEGGGFEGGICSSPEKTRFPSSKILAC